MKKGSKNVKAAVPIAEATLLNRQRGILRRIRVLHELIAERVLYEEELRKRSAELGEIDAALKKVKR